MHPFWQSCVTDFQQELSQHQYNTWIKPLRFEQEGDSFTLIAPNRHVLQWAKERLLTRVEQSGERFFSRPIFLELALEEAEVEAILDHDEVLPASGASANRFRSGASAGSTTSSR